MQELSDEVIKVTKAIEKETGLTLKTVDIYDWFKNCYGKEAGDTSSLYKIIITNPSYNGLTHPMTQNEDGKWIPKWNYRYLTQDVPYGLMVIRGFSLLLSDEYKVQEDVLRKNLKEESAEGSILGELDKNDLHRFGVKCVKHKIDIMKHIKRIVMKQKNDG